MATTLLEVKNLKVYFPISEGFFKQSSRFVKAVDDISFSIHKGETLGIVGESGCGKSTAGRAILRLIQPTSGEIYYEGKDMMRLTASELRKQRQNMQMVFQDPYSSLNPRLTVESILAEPLKAHGIGDKIQQKQKIIEVMELCGLNRAYLQRYAHEFSGGQRQRICIARALILKPKIVVADEPVSALDVSIQSQILNLIQDLQEELQLTFLFISHDLGVVKHLCDRVGVMYLGRMAEIASADSLYAQPLHPYTQTLLSAIPKSNPRIQKERIILQGEVPSPANPPSGCAFSTRCPKVMEQCRLVRPELQEVEPDHFVACHLYA